MLSVNQNEHIINRKKILYEQRYSIRRLALDLHLSPIVVSMAIRGMSKSLTTHRAIATRLNVRLVDFWPELYGDIEQKNFHDSKLNEINESVN
jgi:lambda repressor-like predicted transcriptional regulator